MDSTRYLQPQNPGAGFPPYGSSGYSAPGYGHGPANNVVGYGGANVGYGSPTGATYGNPNVPNAGYAGGAPGTRRSLWNSQVPSGYDAVGYGNATSWGGPNASGGAGSGGTGSAPSGQSPGGAAGYGNQSYGHGRYGGSEGSYANPIGYGAVGGRTGSGPNSNTGGGELQGSGGGYMGGGHGDANGNSGYGNAAWKSDPSHASGNYGAQTNGPHGGQVGYGGGYGAQSRQAQQQ